MKYKINENKGYSSIKHEVLSRRGIEDPEHYLNTTDKDILPYSLFGDVMNEAYNILKYAIENKHGIACLTDVDADGYFSSAMLYSYILKAFNVSINFYIHENKEHGLSDTNLFPRILEDVKSGKIKLLFLPDSGTNDVKECKILKDAGCEIIILDHHQIEKKNSCAIIINPQKVNNYPNIESSGTLVTYKFLKLIDENEWLNYSDEYLDLVACSIISDSMNISNFENRRFINIGLSNIKNKFLSEAILSDYRIKNTPPTAIDIAFYISPLINGMVRSGTQEEKELLFRAICEIDEYFDYSKRDKTIVKETIYQRAVRLCTNAKSRQDRSITKAMETVIEDINLNKRNNNKILFALVDETIDKTFTGLIAQKLASLYNKPCVLLRQTSDDYFAGSIRNFQDSPLTSLKGFLQDLGYVAWIAGHDNASGIGLSKKQLIQTIKLSNEKLANYDFTPIHLIDYEFDFLDPSSLSTLNKDFLLSLYELRYYWGQGISEAKILLKNINVNSSTISFFGAREKSEIKNNWKFELREGMDIISFRADENDIIYKKYGSGNNDGFNWDGDNLSMDVICKVARTEYNGEQRWAFIVEEYEIHS